MGVTWLRFANTIVSYKKLNMIIAFVALLCCFILSIRAETYMDKDVFYIAPILSDSKNYLSAEEVEKIDFPASTSFESRERVAIRFEKTEIYTEIHATNAEYFRLNHMQFVDGNSWTANMGNENVIVLNESLAWRFFGSTNVSGTEIFIDNESYSIVGVTKQNKIDKTTAFAWIPLSKDKYDNKNLTAFLIKPNQYNPINSVRDIESWLGELNRNAPYYIADINMYKNSIALTYRLLLGYIYVCIAIFFTRCIYLLLKTNGLSRRSLPIFIVMLMMNLSLVMFTVYAVQFDIWFPKFSGTFTQQIIQTVFNFNILPPSEYLAGGISELDRLNNYANIAFGIGIVGFINFVFSK